MAVYSLEKEERDSIDKLFDNVPQLEIADELKKKMDEFSDKVLDEVTAYMKDEYVLRFEDIALSQAKKIVIHLLQGKDLDAFGLQTRKQYNREGDWVYDPDKIRAKLVEDFKEQIVTAEILALQTENERLKKDLEYERRINSRYR